MRTFWLHLLNIIVNLFDHIFTSSLLSLLHIYARYFIESVCEIGKWLICNNGNANLYNLGVNATQ